MTVIAGFDYPKPTTPTAHDKPNVMSPHNNDIRSRPASVRADVRPIACKIEVEFFMEHSQAVFEPTTAPGNAVAIRWTRGRKMGGGWGVPVVNRRPPMRVPMGSARMVKVVSVMSVGLR